jgi:hypothetical protein
MAKGKTNPAALAGLMKRKDAPAEPSSRPDPAAEPAGGRKKTARVEPLNFRVEKEFKWEFKKTSFEMQMTQSELLEHIFKFWKENKGD